MKKRLIYPVIGAILSLSILPDDAEAQIILVDSSDIARYDSLMEDRQRKAAEAYEQHGEILDFSDPNIPAEFPGGKEALLKFIHENMDYPVMAYENDIEGIVWVQFLIDKNGNVTNPKVVLSVDPLLDKEAVRLVSILPKWKPAQIFKENVKVQELIAIEFDKGDK